MRQQGYLKMMPQDLKKCLESEKTNTSIFDIVIYGSSVKGKLNPNDIDIMVIFKDGELSVRLDTIQKIKEKIIFIDKIDIKQMLLSDFLKPEHFARTGIIIEGYCIFRGMNVSELFGFKAFAVFHYELKNHSHNEKIKFNYIISGRGKTGILEKYEGVRMVSGTVKVPIKYSILMEDVFIANKVKYKKSEILEII